MNILMIEPDYKSTYPPLGLMKIGYYHKEILNDFVWFEKGFVPSNISDKVKKQILNSKYYSNKYGKNIEKFLDYANDVISNKKWDRIYVCTLFTFEYEKTLEAIEKAKKIVGKDNVYTGGILATLMPNKLRNDTGVIINTGQLIDSVALGFKDHYNIDRATPDYSILENTEYKYENNNAFYAYATRGCGMNCEFCAVKILEPEYKPFISIKNQIEEVRRLYGDKKDLLLMDNNVLKSCDLDKIISEITELGFGKNSIYKNPNTNKESNRYVDFNQGLDAFLINEKKARLLSSIALKPARIAFDHIEDKEVYIKAVETIAKYGTKDISNYLLYNSDDFKGKGHQYRADSPDDFYNRLKINVELQEKLNLNYNDKCKDGKKFTIFSFPMRYIPLDDSKRGYIGPKWNKKQLRSIQCLLNPTQGKGISGREFFEISFGSNVNEFNEIIMMPENYILRRGDPRKSKRKKNIKIIKRKLLEYEINKRNIMEWQRLYQKIQERCIENFDELIGSNQYEINDFTYIDNYDLKCIFLHYLSDAKKISLINHLSIMNQCEELALLRNYMNIEYKSMYYQLLLAVLNNTNFLKSDNVDLFTFLQNDFIVQDVLSVWLISEKNITGITKLANFFKIKKDYFYILKWANSLFDLDVYEFQYIIKQLGIDDGLIEVKKRVENILYMHLKSHLSENDEINSFIKNVMKRLLKNREENQL